MASRPAPPGHANGARTALPARRPAPAGSYLPPAPSPRHLKHPETTPGTGGPPPAAEHLPRLASNVLPPVTSLGSVTQSRAVCRASPRGHRLRRPRGRRFRGAEHRSTPLPTRPTSSHFGLASPDGTDRQALAGLSWLSYSRLPDLPEDPGPGHGPAPTVASRGLPTPVRLNGPDGTLTRIAARGGCGPNPRRGIKPARRRPHPLRSTRPAAVGLRGRSVPVAPLRYRLLTHHRIERRDSSPGSTPLPYDGSGPRGTTPTSLRRTGRTRLRVSGATGFGTHAAGEAAPFAPLVRRNSRAVPPVSMTVRKRSTFPNSRSESRC